MIEYKWYIAQNKKEAEKMIVQDIGSPYYHVVEELEEPMSSFFGFKKRKSVKIKIMYNKIDTIKSKNLKKYNPSSKNKKQLSFPNNQSNHLSGSSGSNILLTTEKKKETVSSKKRLKKKIKKDSLLLFDLIENTDASKDTINFEDKNKTKDIRDSLKEVIDHKEKEINGSNNSIDFTEKYNSNNHYSLLDLKLEQRDKINQPLDNSFSVSSNNDFQEETLLKEDDNSNAYYKKEIESFLKKLEYDDSFIQKILQNLESKNSFEQFEKNTSNRNEFITHTDNLKIIAEVISNCIEYKSIKKYSNVVNVVILLGPTGIGKTTTLSKIVTSFKFKNKESLPKYVMATMDNVRLMAAAQYEKMSHWLDFPFCIIKDQNSIKSLIQDYCTYDYIFMDTAGLSPHNQEEKIEIKNLIEYIDVPKEKHLCISASIRFKEMIKIIRQFKEFNVDSISVTKFDESEMLGPILSAISKFKIPVSFFTNGQDIVPEYLLPASSNFIVKSLIKEWESN